MLELVRPFSNAISMDFGIDKCALLHVKRGIIQKSENITVIDKPKIGALKTRRHINSWVFIKLLLLTI